MLHNAITLSVFLGAFLTGLVLTWGSPSQRLISQLHAHSRTNYPLLMIGWLAALATTSLAAWLGQLIGLAASPTILPILLAIAGLGAMVQLVRSARGSFKPLAEPTRSLGAISAVFLTGMAVDSARIIVFALAAFTPGWWEGVAGGTIGTGLALTYGWIVGEPLKNRTSLRMLRIIASIALIATILSIVAIRYFAQLTTS